MPSSPVYLLNIAKCYCGLKSEVTTTDKFWPSCNNMLPYVHININMPTTTSSSTAVSCKNKNSKRKKSPFFGNHTQFILSPEQTRKKGSSVYSQQTTSAPLIFQCNTVNNKNEEADTVYSFCADVKENYNVQANRRGKKVEGGRGCTKRRERNIAPLFEKRKTNNGWNLTKQ